MSDTTPRSMACIAALGDLMLVGEWDDLFRESARAADRVREVRALLEAHDVVFANLETTASCPFGCIPKQPRVISSAAVVGNCLRAFRVDLVNLANNHAFDSSLAGFRRARDLLDRTGVRHFGAGESLDEASRPCIVEANGIRFGWLGYADFDTRPSHVAAATQFGVNPFTEASALAAVSALAPRVDHVIVSLHWGVEFCHLPSPDQRRVARRLIEQGASLVVGHHAHVVQGIERWGMGAIAYNLGNVTTSDFAIDGRLAIRQSPRTRTSFLLSASFTKRALESVQPVPIRSLDSGRFLVKDPVATRIVARANRQLRTTPSRTSWRLRRVYEDVFLRTMWKLHPQVIRSVRARHAIKLVQNLSLAARGHGPA